MAAQPGVSGYVVAGLGTGESPALRQQIVESVVAALPPAAPRLLSGVGTPEEVLEAVSQGIDLLDMGYLADATGGGYALCFPLAPQAGQQQQQQLGQQQQGAPAAAASGGGACDGAAEAADAAADAGGDDSKMNLWALAYRTDRQPMVPGCACFTCASHSRAYLHHLLQTHEMTAQARAASCPKPIGNAGSRRLLRPLVLFPAEHCPSAAASPCCRCCWRRTTRTTTCNSLKPSAAASPRAALRPTGAGSCSGGSGASWGSSSYRPATAEAGGGAGAQAAARQMMLAF